MNIVSLFDGMACGAIAFKNANIPIDNYWAYEIDKYAIKTSSYNFPFIKHCGDIFDADFTQYHDIDFVIGGSPCTKWSIAQKKDREVTASGIGWELFSQYVKAINIIKPKYFIYENNKSMSREIKDSISNAFGFEPICINSALLSAQTRQRLYWVGKRNDNNTYDKVNVSQPIDKGILLKDILDDNYTVLSDREMEYMCRGNLGKFTDRWSYLQRLYVDDKAKCLVANIRKGVPCNVCAVPIQVGALPRPNGELSTSQGFRIYDINGKSVTLKGNAGGSGGKTGLYAIPTDDVTAYIVKDKHIIFNKKKYPINLPDGYYIIRKLTVTECMRLQTVPEWYVFPVSKTQSLKLLGNGWTCDIISHILNEIMLDK